MRWRCPQRGAALIILAAILAVGASWFMVTRVAGLASSFTVSERQRNAAVLNLAKQALVGYVAFNAAQAGENNPGRLPCPEANADVGMAASEGTASSSCALPAVGRLPWRTLGLDKLVDAKGEPLWYVVSPGWAKPAPLATLSINSDTPGQLTVDGQANAAVALIIAPGAPMNVQAAAGCTARNQLARLAPAPGIVAADYIECFNPAASVFSSVGPTASFNDQVVQITVADLMPAIEAAISHRIEREIVPPLKSVYGTPTWGLSAANPLFAYPAPFGNPGTSTYQGVAGTASGLLPFNSQSCVGDPRCLTIVSWRNPIVASVTQTGGTGSLQAGTTCTLIAGNTQARCQGTYIAVGPTELTMSVRADNVAMGLRSLDASQMTAEYFNLAWNPTAASASASFVNDGSGDIKATATFPGLLSLPITFRMTIDIAALVDHPILNAADPTTGWFVRNQWFRVLYYVPAARHTAGGGALPTPSCATGVNCLTVANVTPAGAQRAILVLAGRSINGSARPSAVLADYLEYGNANANWERQRLTALLPASYADTGGANAYVVAAAVAPGLPLQFVAGTSNTGASTLNTPVTGVKDIRNPNGSALAASQIRANAAVQVAYDGTQFVLSKRPFNDRIIVLDSN